MNNHLFEVKRNAEDQINTKVRSLVANMYMYISSNASPDVSNELMPSWIVSYYGYSIKEAHEYTDLVFVDNPHFDPSLPHSEENIKLQTGFKSISKDVNNVSIILERCYDQYDDFDEIPDTFSFVIESSVFFGTNDEIKEWIDNTYSNLIVTKTKIDYLKRFKDLFTFSSNDLRKFADALDKHERNKYGCHTLDQQVAIADEVLNT